MKKIQLFSIILLTVLAINGCKKVAPEQGVTTSTTTVSTVAGSSGSGDSGSYVDGTGSQASFNDVSGMVTDTEGNLYVTDQYNHCIRKITPAGVVSTFAGSGENGHLDGAGKNAEFSYPYGITIDASGNLYVSEYTNFIRKVTPAGVVSTYAGTGDTGYKDGPAAAAKFNNPTGLAMDKTGNLYVADTWNRLIRKITPSGIVSTYAGVYSGGDIYGGAYNVGYRYTGMVSGLLFGQFGPMGVAIDPSGNIYVADSFIQFIYKITPDGMVRTIGSSHGEGAAGTYRDGSGTTARFRSPINITSDATGNVYVADQGNNRIRKIDADGIVSTVAGNGSMTDVDGLASEASFFSPNCVTIDSKGIVYAGEWNMIRKIETITNTTNPKNTWNNPQSWGNPR